MPENPLEKDLTERLAAARAAMATPEQQARREAADKLAAARRRQAMLAMETAEQRQKREAREKAERDATLAAALATEEARRARADVERQKADLAAKQAAAAKNQAATLAKKTATANRAKELINQIQTADQTIVGSLRTLKSDLAKAISEEQLTASKITMKNTGRLATNMEISRAGGRRSFILGLVSLILLGAGGGISYFVWKREQKPVSTVQPFIINSLVFAETQVEVNFDNQSPGAAATAVTTLRYEHQVAVGGIQNIYFTETTTDRTAVVATQKRLVGFTAVATKIGATIPDNLGRFLDGRFMFGVYGVSTSVSQPFLILKTKLFANTAEALLKFESTMPLSLAPFFGMIDSGTSSPLIFHDQVIKNHDTRVVLNSAGQIVFLYSFIDPETIILTTGREAFLALEGRLATPSPTGAN